SDDARAFGYSRLFVSMMYWVFGKAADPYSLNVEAQASMSGLWGSDNLAGARFGIDRLNFSLKLFDMVTLTIGRQHYGIGGTPDDYLLDDTLDAVVVTFTPVKQAGTFRVLAFDLMGIGVKPQDVDFASYLSTSDVFVPGFDADSDTTRFG